MTAVQDWLFSLQDIEYRDFQSKLCPTIAPDTIIGVRTPELRAYAKKAAKEGRADVKKAEETAVFMQSLPHRYFEENQLHAFLISEVKDFEVCMAELEVFLPYVDNWATCDQLSPGLFKKNAQRLLPYIDHWLDSAHIYTVRFGIGMLMRYFLDEGFEEAYADRVASIPADRQYYSRWDSVINFRDANICITKTGTAKASDADAGAGGINTVDVGACDADVHVAGVIPISKTGDRPYYINMMIAWYFATALAKQYDRILPYLEEYRLDPWTHNKTIQKAVESDRIRPEQKTYLKTLRIQRGKTEKYY
ncbi:MAG: DNA alkylation repair protein [Clostridiales bacterium]|nr:DNA alkylation repair protein [Clostridiales bacterium]